MDEIYPNSAVGSSALDVLIVDADRGVARSLAMLFSCYGCGVRVAQTGDDALAKARESAPDAAVVEVILGGMGGLETAKKLRMMHPRCRITLVCAVAASSIVDEARERGFRLYWKPVPPEVLLGAAGVRVARPVQRVPTFAVSTASRA